MNHSNWIIFSVCFFHWLAPNRRCSIVHWLPVPVKWYALSDGIQTHLNQFVDDIWNNRRFSGAYTIDQTHAVQPNWNIIHLLYFRQMNFNELLVSCLEFGFNFIWVYHFWALFHVNIGPWERGKSRWKLWRLLVSSQRPMADIKLHRQMKSKLIILRRSWTYSNEFFLPNSPTPKWTHRKTSSIFNKISHERIFRVFFFVGVIVFRSVGGFLNLISMWTVSSLCSLLRADTSLIC